MAKNDLGISFEDALNGNVLIDTDTGNIIKQDSDIMDRGKNDDKSEEGEIPKKTDLFEVNKEKEEEKKVEEHVEEKKQKSSGDNALENDDDSSSLPQFKVLVNALHEKGIISELDDSIFEDKDTDAADKMFNLINKEIEKNVSTKFEEKIRDLPDGIKKMINAGGAEEKVAGDVMKIRETATALKKLDDDKIGDDIDLQKNLISESLRQKGYSEDRIKKRLTQFNDLGVLEEEAKVSLKEIITELDKEETTLIEDAKEQEKEEVKSREESLKTLKKEVFDSNHIIDGMELTEKEKQKIFDSMTKVIDKDTSGNPLNEVMVTRSRNPLAFEKALHYYHALGLFNIDKDGVFTPDISKIKTSAKASAVEELSKALKTEQRTQTGRPARENKMDSAALKERIERMKSALPL